MTDCPTCGRPFPIEPVWKFVRQRDDGQWEASVRLGQYAGWAIQDTEELARTKALARLHYAKDLNLK